MSSTVKVTSLFTLPRRELQSWYGRPDFAVCELARDAVADWAGVDSCQIGILEDQDGGEFFTLNGEPVAFLETRYERADNAVRVREAA